MKAEKGGVFLSVYSFSVGFVGFFVGFGFFFFPCLRERHEHSWLFLRIKQ